MRGKYTLATIFLLTNFDCSAVIARSMDEMKDREEFQSESQQSTMKTIPPASVFQVQNPLLQRRPWPTKEETLKRVVMISDYHQWPPVSFFPFDDRLMARTIKELFEDNQ